MGSPWVGVAEVTEHELRAGAVGGRKPAIEDELGERIMKAPPSGLVSASRWTGGGGSSFLTGNIATTRTSSSARDPFRDRTTGAGGAAGSRALPTIPWTSCRTSSIGPSESLPCLDFSPGASCCSRFVDRCRIPPVGRLRRPRYPVVAAQRTPRLSNDDLFLRQVLVFCVDSIIGRRQVLMRAEGDSRCSSRRGGKHPRPNGR